MTLSSYFKKFCESTMQQVLLILFLMIIALVIAFIKVPSMKISTYSFRLSWDVYFEPIQVLDDMMELKMPGTLEILIDNMDDDRLIPGVEVDKRQEFYDDDKYKVGDYCLFLFRKYTVDFDEIPYKRDKYSWITDFAEMNKWYEDAEKFLVWDSKSRKFVDSRVVYEEE